MLPGSSISSSVSHFSDRCHCKRINKEIHNRINKQFSRAVNEVNAKQENNGFYFKKSFPNSSQINELNSYPNYSLTIGPKDKSKIFCYKKFSFHLGTFPA
ncbi:MAG: hypothetical protein Q8K60_04330 [Parachlamydiaceae bacterium]|nr:hypothetical protein [Parachlamydiaceae bacterium]